MGGTLKIRQRNCGVLEKMEKKTREKESGFFYQTFPDSFMLLLPVRNVPYLPKFDMIGGLIDICTSLVTEFRL